MSPVRFSIKRALAVFAVFSVYLAAIRPQTVLHIALAVGIASSWSGVILLTRPEDLPRLVRTVVWSVIGAITGFAFSPAQASTGYNDTFTPTIIAAAIGTLCGAFLATRSVRPREPGADPKTP